MREIKFRVWDNQNKHYLHSLNGRGLDFFAHSQELLPLSDYFFKDNFIIQQFTGFLDKNGVEVYEGDIIGGESEMVYLMSGQKSGRKTYQEYEIIWNSARGCWAKKDMISNFVSDRIDISLGFYPVIRHINQ